jgi:hypothetical protein
MANKEDDFSAFDSVMSIPDDEFTAFDTAMRDTAQPKKNIFQKTGDLLAEGASAGAELALDTVSPFVTGEASGLKDFSLGAAQGATFGFADEIAARASQFIDPLISKLSGEEALNEQLRQQGFQVEQPETTYEDELKRTREVFKKAEEESPWLYGGGYLAGSLPSGQALGGALNLATKGTRLAQLAQASRAGRIGKMAAEGALGAGIEAIGSSEGSITGTPEQQEQLTGDIATGAGIGAIAGGGIGTLSEVAVPAAKKMLKPVSEKIGEFVEETPFLRQLGVSAKYGEQGINPVAESSRIKTTLGEEGLVRRDTSRAQGLMDEILTADKTLASGISDSLEKASERGVRIDAYEPLQKSLRQLNVAYDKLEEIGTNTRGKYILDKIANSVDKSLDPLEAKMLLDDVDAFINKFGRITPGTATTTESLIAENLQSFRRNFSNNIKEAVPEYKTAAKRFEEFRRFVPESVISGDLPVEVTDVFMGELKTPEKQLLLKLRALVKSATKTGQTAEPVGEAFENVIQGIKKFEQAEAARGLKSPLPRTGEEYFELIKNYADDAAARRQMASVEEMASIQRNIPAAVMETGSTFRSGALTTANLYGQAKRGARKLSQKLYTAPREQLDSLANKLSSVPGLGSLGRALKEGVESNDSFKKNAALFSIMQNPSAKLLIDSEDEWEE